MHTFISKLIEQMVDGGTLPTLSREEIDELAYKATDGLVPYIVEVSEY